MFEDAKPLTSANWNDIHLWLTYFWIYVPLVLTFALTMLTAHAIIPSLMITGHMPASIGPLSVNPGLIGRIRIMMTAFAGLVALAAVIMMVLTVNKALDVDKFWDRWLI